jgi:MarR family transcriptional regulator, 2-MHQ and catechol-resistance regulon repressor
VVVEHGRQLFASYSDADFDSMDLTLSKLKQLIADHSTCPTSPQQKEEF